MRLFGYYAWHSFVNQLRKLFKTWVLIFLVICMAIGALIGFGAAMLDDAAGEDEEIVDSEVIEDKKDLQDQDNHDGVITHLEPDILECEIKWALESITTNKASGR